MREGVDTETFIINTRENDRGKLFQELDVVGYELGKRFNRPWKIDPQDIADFYLSANVGYRPPEYQSSDEENVMLLRAKARMTEIGERISFAIIHEGFREHTKFYEGLKEVDPELFQRIVPPYLMFEVSRLQKAISEVEKHPAGEAETAPQLLIDGRESVEDLRKTLGYYQAFLDAEQKNGELTDYPIVIREAAALYHVGIARMRLKEFEGKPKGAIKEIQTDKQFWKDAMTVMELTYRYPQWTKMFELARAILFPEERNEKILPDVVQKEDAVSFLTDLLINAVHATGDVIAFIANNLPETVLVLTLHGLKEGDEFLWEHASRGLRQELQNRSKPLLRKLGVQSSGIKEWDNDVRQEFLRRLRKGGGQLYKLGCLIGCKDESLRMSLIDMTKSWLRPGQKLSEYSREVLSNLAGPSF